MLEDDALFVFYFLALGCVRNEGLLRISVKKKSIQRRRENVGAIGTCTQPNVPLKSELIDEQRLSLLGIFCQNMFYISCLSAQSQGAFRRRKNVAQALVQMTDFQVWLGWWWWMMCQCNN